MNANDLSTAIHEYLLHTRELHRFCVQNGWIDNDSLHFHVESRSADQVEITVRFDEVIMEGAGCVADRRNRFGRLRLRIDDNGHIQSDDAV